MQISGIVKFSTLDYPGNISAVLFSPGCNYDCFYCHNREILRADVQLMSNDDVMDFLKNRQGLIDAVVFSGGEVTLQLDLLEWAKLVKSMEYLVKIDTNGSRPDVVETLIQAGTADYFAVDYKAPFARYTELFRVDSEPVKQTFALLSASPVQYEARTTVIPQLTHDDLITMAREAPVFPTYALQTYRAPELYRPEHALLVRQKPHDTAWVEEAANVVREYQPNVVLRG